MKSLISLLSLLVFMIEVIYAQDKNYSSVLVQNTSPEDIEIEEKLHHMFNLNQTNHEGVASGYSLFGTKFPQNTINTPNVNYIHQSRSFQCWYDEKCSLNIGSGQNQMEIIDKYCSAEEFGQFFLPPQTQASAKQEEFKYLEDWRKNFVDTPLWCTLSHEDGKIKDKSGICIIEILWYTPLRDSQKIIFYSPKTSHIPPKTLTELGFVHHYAFQEPLQKNHVYIYPKLVNEVNELHQDLSYLTNAVGFSYLSVRRTNWGCNHQVADVKLKLEKMIYQENNLKCSTENEWFKASYVITTTKKQDGKYELELTFEKYEIHNNRNKNNLKLVVNHAGKRLMFWVFDEVAAGTTIVKTSQKIEYTPKLDKIQVRLDGVVDRPGNDPYCDYGIAEYQDLMYIK